MNINPSVSSSSSYDSDSSSSSDGESQRMSMPPGFQPAFMHPQAAYAAPQAFLPIAMPAQPMMMPQHFQQQPMMPPGFQQPMMMPPGFQQQMMMPPGFQQPMMPPGFQQAMGHPAAAAYQVNGADDEPIASNDYSGLIDDLVLNSSRKTVAQINERVGMASQITRRDANDRNTFHTDAFGGVSDSGQFFKFDGEYKENTDTFIIKYSWRTNFSELNASDAYLAQLGKAIPSSDDHLPRELPNTIIRHHIINDTTKDAINQVYQTYRSNPSSQVNLSLDRSNPSSTANRLLHELLANTPNGKSTAHLVSDFNKARDTEYTIEGVTVRKAPLYQLDFRVRP